MKSYSKLNVREKIAADLGRIEKDLAFYKETLQEGGFVQEERIQGLESQKERLNKLAEHYDDEVQQGYKHPTTHRW